MRFTNLLQRETDRLLKSFLDDNPELLNKYVNGSLAAISTVLAPINVFMKHLLAVQGLDPNSTPGESQRLQLLEAIGQTFSQDHEDAFDEDYDLSWVQKKFEDTRKKLNALEMTKEKFMEMTDLDKLPNIVSSRYPTIDEQQEVLKNLPGPLPSKEIPIFDPVNPLDALREAVKAIEKEAGLKDKKKKGVKTAKKKLNKTTGKPLKVKRASVQAAPVPEVEEEKVSTLKVESTRVESPNWKKTPARNLRDIASDRKAQVKAAKESTPEFKAQLKARLLRATELTNFMIEKGLVESNEQARQDQINSMISWSDNNFDALERVVHKYAPTKDAVAENKFKGSFRRIVK